MDALLVDRAREIRWCAGADCLAGAGEALDQDRVRGRSCNVGRQAITQRRRHVPSAEKTYDALECKLGKAGLDCRRNVRDFGCALLVCDREQANLSCLNAQERRQRSGDDPKTTLREVWMARFCSR